MILFPLNKKRKKARVREVLGELTALHLAARGGHRAACDVLVAAQATGISNAGILLGLLLQNSLESEEGDSNLNLEFGSTNLGNLW